jgi:predicted component of type VI protein secretion system
VSANHAIVQRREGKWWLSELQSRNGVRVNGLPLTGPIALQPGMRIDLGHSRLYAYGNVAVKVEAGTPGSLLDALLGYYGSLKSVGERLSCSAMTVTRMLRKARR